MGWFARAGQLVDHFMVLQMAVQSPHLCESNSYALRPRCVTWIKTKTEGVKSECSGGLKLSKPVLSCKDNKCSDAGAGDLSVLTSYETYHCGNVGSTRVKVSASK